MARRPFKALTNCQIELMHAFWKVGEMTASDARREMARLGHDLADPTVAILTRTLVAKRCLEPVDDRRPFRYRPARTFDEVSLHLVDDFVERVFNGSLERMLVVLFQRRKVSEGDRALLHQIADGQAR